jgi:acyl carrier protein
MLRELGRIAGQRHLAHVSVRFRPTGRNQPALDFLNGLQLGAGQPCGEELIFRFPTESTLGVTFAPEAAAPTRSEATRPPVTDATDTRWLHAKSQLLCRIAEELHSAKLILRDMEGKKPRLAHVEVGQDYVPPRTATEKALCAIWQELLGMDRIGARHNFFDMGGHSLLATQVLLRIQDTLGVELSIQDVFEAPTVTKLAAVVETRRIERAEPQQVLEILEEIDGLTDDQIDKLLLRERQQR